MIKLVFKFIKNIWVQRSCESIQNYYRSLGVKIGIGGEAFHPRSLKIDVTLPSLVEIGNHVFLDEGLTILTHDWVSWTFLELYKDFVSSSGRVIIGNNVWFDKNVTVLKGVTIGDNCTRGPGSVVQ
jgi:acetyltransferase-like isoleucine patch superfamily enzyme